MKEENNKISILILDYLKSKRVTENVKLLMKQKGSKDFEILIVDNSCNELNRKKLEELKKYENVTLVFNEKNLGYTRAYNRIARLATGKYLFIINPDILVKDAMSIQKMVNFMEENSDVGILGPQQINDDGSIAMTVRAFPKFYIQVARRTFLRNWPLFKKKVDYDEMKHLNWQKTQSVDWLQSSFIVIRKKFWDQVGGLDENYFLFMSDPEICYQAWKKGEKVIYFPEVKVYADGIRCSEGGFLTFFRKWTLRQHVIDSLKYRLKHLIEKNPRKG
ncbi:glycosyltransferase [Candidatus Peregrinibacteria bacterium]|nr:glycosyltransferase [Candidatus Peregrinibacteria bacterium]